jgi:hypothetical protein
LVGSLPVGRGGGVGGGQLPAGEPVLNWLAVRHDSNSVFIKQKIRCSLHQGGMDCSLEQVLLCFFPRACKARTCVHT